MKLVIAIVHNRDKGRVTDELVSAGFKFTIIGSTGGFLREGNTTYLVGAEDEDLDTLIGVLKANCSAREQVVTVGPMEGAGAAAFLSAPMKVPVGGAVVFVLPVDRFERF